MKSKLVLMALILYLLVLHNVQGKKRKDYDGIKIQEKKDPNIIDTKQKIVKDIKEIQKSIKNNEKIGKDNNSNEIVKEIQKIENKILKKKGIKEGSKKSNNLEDKSKEKIVNKIVKDLKIKGNSQKKEKKIIDNLKAAIKKEKAIGKIENSINKKMAKEKDKIIQDEILTDLNKQIKEEAKQSEADAEMKFFTNRRNRKKIFNKLAKDMEEKKQEEKDIIKKIEKKLEDQIEIPIPHIDKRNKQKKKDKNKTNVQQKEMEQLIEQQLISDSVDSVASNEKQDGIQIKQSNKAKKKQKKSKIAMLENNVDQLEQQMMSEFQQQIKTNNIEFYILGIFFIICCYIGYKLTRASKSDYDYQSSGGDIHLPKSSSLQENDAHAFYSKGQESVEHQERNEIFQGPTILEFYKQSNCEGGNLNEIIDNERIKDEFLDEELANDNYFKKNKIFNITD